jgi:hypothetical protein
VGKPQTTRTAFISNNRITQLRLLRQFQYSSRATKAVNLGHGQLSAIVTTNIRDCRDLRDVGDAVLTTAPSIGEKHLQIVVG